MANAKPNYPSITTPKGILKFPKLNVPDTKFKAEGEYTAKIIVTGSEAAPIIKMLKPLQEEAMASARAELEKTIAETKGEAKGKAKKALLELEPASDPYKPVYDDDGNETGDYEFNFKMAAQYKDRKTGKIKQLRPHLFDAGGKPIVGEPPEIWGGTVARVSGFAKPFYNPATKSAGVSLRLQAVQIIELRSGGSGKEASSYGFGAEEGFQAADLPAKPVSPFNDDDDEGVSGSDDAGGADAGDPTAF